jgi:hypothetical protein
MFISLSSLIRSRNMDTAAKNFGVALTKCYYCGKDNEIILNKWLTEHMAKQVESMNGMVINMSPCPTCEGYMKQGIILLTIDSNKSDKDWHTRPAGKPLDQTWIPNPYRTGGFVVVREEAIGTLLGVDTELFKQAQQRRFMFIEHETAVSIGLLKNATQETDD